MRVEKRHKLSSFVDIAAGLLAIAFIIYKGALGFDLSLTEYWLLFVTILWATAFMLARPETETEKLVRGLEGH